MKPARERILGWVAVVALALSVATCTAFVWTYSHDMNDLRKVVCGTFTSVGNYPLPKNAGKGLTTIVEATRHGAQVAKCPGVH